MYIKQISIFVENKPGRLADITGILADNKIDIRALSIADTTDYGILRLIVNDPDTALEKLKAAGITSSITNVLAIGIPDEAGAFSDAIRTLSAKGINVEYAYAFITPEAGAAYVIIRVEDNDAAAEALKGTSIKLIGQQEIFNQSK
ncbi:MAG: ACT domain-containing protein [Clostridiales bacterium]|nr:ACT domain-containing protein [Clostridiales bacterium]